MATLPVNTKPLRLRILEAITDALKEITPDNGYKHDLSESVFRGRTWYGEDDPLPLVSILEDPLPINQDMAGQGARGDGTESKGGWTLLVQGFVEDDKVNPTDPAHHLMADVKKRLAIARKRTSSAHAHNRYNLFGMGGAVESLSIGAGVVRPPDYDVSSKAYFWLTITLTLVEDLEDPFA